MISSSVNTRRPVLNNDANSTPVSDNHQSDSIIENLENAVESDNPPNNIDSNRTTGNASTSERIVVYPDTFSIGELSQPTQQLIGYHKPGGKPLSPALDDLNIVMRILCWLCALCFLSLGSVAAKTIPIAGARWEVACFVIQCASFVAQICFFVLSCIREGVYGIPLFLPLRTYCIITEIIEASMCLIGCLISSDYTCDKFKRTLLAFGIILYVLAATNWVWAMLIHMKVFANYTDNHCQFLLQAHKYQAMDILGDLVVPYAPRSKFLTLSKRQQRVMNYCSRYTVGRLVSLYDITPEVICINELRLVIRGALKTNQCGSANGSWCGTKKDLCTKLVTIIYHIEKLEGKPSVVGKGPYTLKHPNEFVAFLV